MVRFLRLALVPVALAVTQTAIALPWLHAAGTQIVDQSGKTVLLRGVNLGGWLVEEMWMMPFVTQPAPSSILPEIEDHVSLWGVIEKRFGQEGVRRIRTALRDNWLTDADFDRMKAAGFNCVRLPFLYDLLDEPDGFRWLDIGIERAAKRGMYTILDMHGAPGRQSKDHHTGHEGENRFFQDRANVEKAAELWARIARRYRDRAEVAGFDLLNEPMGAPNVATLYAVQDRLYRAIRAVDGRHMIIVEDGYTGFNQMPYPAAIGWTNVAFSIHLYQFDARTEQDHVAVLQSEFAKTAKGQPDRQVPIYIGEFNLEPHTSARLAGEFLRDMREHGWSWTVWTYKVVMPHPEMSMWGIYRDPKPPPLLDPFRDSEAELIRKMSGVRTENLVEYPGLVETHRAVRR